MGEGKRHAQLSGARRPSRTPPRLRRDLWGALRKRRQGNRHSRVLKSAYCGRPWEQTEVDMDGSSARAVPAPLYRPAAVWMPLPEHRRDPAPTPPPEGACAQVPASVRYKRRKKAQETGARNVHFECLRQRPAASQVVTGAGDTWTSKAPVRGRGDTRQSSLQERSALRQTGRPGEGRVRAGSAEGGLRPPGATAGPRPAPRAPAEAEAGGRRSRKAVPGSGSGDAHILWSLRGFLNKFTPALPHIISLLTSPPT